MAVPKAAMHEDRDPARWENNIRFARQVFDVQSIAQTGSMQRAANPHFAGRREDVIDRGDVLVDLPRRTVEVRGKPVALTFVEFELLALLASEPGVVFSRRQLLERIRGSADYREPRTIDVHVRHLREKIERDSDRDFFMSGEEAKAYGLVDEVIISPEKKPADEKKK